MSVLFFACANEAYEDFAPLYAFSILAHVPDARVEIGIENERAFHTRHQKALSIIQKSFGKDRLDVRSVGWTLPNGKRIVPNTVRFVNEPRGKADYVYIGDIDIIVLDPHLVDAHLHHMKKTGLPYSNSIRPSTERMSGLHFTKADAHYPLPQIDDLDLHRMNDEAVLYTIVVRKGLPVQPDRWYRPMHGIHVSPNRSIMPVVGENGAVTPGWGIQPHRQAWIKFAARPDFARLREVLSTRVQGHLREIDAAVGRKTASKPLPATSPLFAL